VALNPEKKNPTDFALWKFSPKDHQRDMEWPSPWGVGFPSWHIECSTMIKKFLGETIDIHAGGIDHIAIHHTNEIAISEATTGKALAKYWLHSNFVMVDNQKISKSIGNTITLEDIEAKGFSLEAFRLWALQSHYRNEAQFSWPILQAAQNRLDSYQAMADLIWQPVKTDSLNKIVFSDSKILSSLQSDLNSPQALSIIDDKAAILSTKLLPATDINNFRHMLSSIDKLFGLKLADRPDISDAQKTMIASRETARRDKDFVKSDNLRKKLQEQSILVRDTPQGPIWSRLGNQA
jgi:cysteinyl-tRNA synthetase